MQSQGMCFETNLAGSSLFEYRPNSRPESCKYNYFISSFVGFVVYDSTLILNMFLQLQVSKYLNMS